MAEPVVFDLRRSRLALDGPAAAGLASCLCALLPRSASRAEGFGPTLSASATYGDAPTAEAGLPLSYAGTMPDGSAGALYETDRLSEYVIPTSGAALIDHAAGVARLKLRRDVPAGAAGGHALRLIDAALALGGQFLIHGACLTRGGRAVLLCGISGAGKTTAALALAHGGYALATDDAAVLAPEPAPALWGLPRPPRVHRRTADLLPWLQPLPDRWDAAGEQPLPPEALRGRIAMDDGRPKPLAAIVLLGERRVGRSRIELLSGPDALAALAADNVGWRPGGPTLHASRRFAALAAAVSRTPRFRLSAGRDLDALPALLARETGT